MDYTVRDDNGRRWATLRGQLTYDASPALAAIHAGFETGAVRECVLDLEGLDFIDSAGLGLLVVLYNCASRAGVTLKMHRPQGQVREMIELSEFQTFIPCAF